MHRFLPILLLLACSQPSVPSGEPQKALDTTDRSIGSPAATSDREIVAQMTIDVPGLQEYFHGRKPLAVVVNRHVNPAWSLTFAGEPIKWVDETSEEARIEFTLLRIEGDKAGATISYDIEGVIMHAEFSRGARGWTLTDAEVAER